jgi:hypothetical protein
MDTVLLLIVIPAGVQIRREGADEKGIIDEEGPDEKILPDEE